MWKIIYLNLAICQLFSTLINKTKVIKIGNDSLYVTLVILALKGAQYFIFGTLAAYLFCVVAALLLSHYPMFALNAAAGGRACTYSVFIMH